MKKLALAAVAALTLASAPAIANEQVSADPFASTQGSLPMLGTLGAGGVAAITVVVVAIVAVVADAEESTTN